MGCSLVMVAITSVDLCYCWLHRCMQSRTGRAGSTRNTSKKSIDIFLVRKHYQTPVGLKSPVSRPPGLCGIAGRVEGKSLAKVLTAAGAALIGGATLDMAFLKKSLDYAVYSSSGMQICRGEQTMPDTVGVEL